jgi:hypothetical protein
MSKALQDRMEETFPFNTHPLPIATSWDGKEWTVDLAARDEEGMDLDVTASDVSPQNARDKAFQRITKSYTMYKRYGYVPN